MDRLADQDFFPEEKASQIALIQSAIQVCKECHASCIGLINHCLRVGGNHAEPSHIRLLLDCAQICQTSVDFLLRRSDMFDLICSVCSEICQAAVEDCEGFPGEDQMREGAEVCRRCADICERLAEEQFGIQ